MAKLIGLQLPIPWDEFELPNPLATSSSVLTTGDFGWDWGPEQPSLPIPSITSPHGDTAEGWDLDHVVLLVPSLDEALGAMAAIGEAPRLRLEVAGRPAAHFRVGPVLEVIESPVPQASIFGVALVTEQPLEIVALRWRAMGRDLTDPRPAIQRGRRILTVGALEAGLAVMSPERAS